MSGERDPIPVRVILNSRKGDDFRDLFDVARYAMAGRQEGDSSLIGVMLNGKYFSVRFNKRTVSVWPSS